MLQYCDQQSLFCVSMDLFGPYFYFTFLLMFSTVSRANSVMFLVCKFSQMVRVAPMPTITLAVCPLAPSLGMLDGALLHLFESGVLVL